MNIRPMTETQSEAEFEAFWAGWLKAFPLTTPESQRSLARAAWYAGRLALCESMIAERAARRSALAELGV